MFHRSRPSTSNPRVGTSAAPPVWFRASKLPPQRGTERGPFRGRCWGMSGDGFTRCADHGGVSAASIQFSAVSGSTPEWKEHPRAPATTVAPIPNSRSSAVQHREPPFQPVLHRSRPFVRWAAVTSPNRQPPNRPTDNPSCYHWYSLEAKVRFLRGACRDFKVVRSGPLVTCTVDVQRNVDILKCGEPRLAAVCPCTRMRVIHDLG